MTTLFKQLILAWVFIKVQKGFSDAFECISMLVGILIIIGRQKFLHIFTILHKFGILHFLNILGNFVVRLDIFLIIFVKSSFDPNESKIQGISSLSMLKTLAGLPNK